MSRLKSAQLALRRTQREKGFPQRGIPVAVRRSAPHDFAARGNPRLRGQDALATAGGTPALLTEDGGEKSLDPMKESSVLRFRLGFRRGRLNYGVEMNLPLR